MTDCDSIPTRLSLQLDRQLSDPESAGLEADLRDCPQYVLLAQTMAQIDFMFRSSPLLAPSRDLTRGVLEAIEQRRDQRLLGLTFLVGSLVSLVPTVLFAILLMFGFAVVAQPGAAQQLIAGVTRWLGEVYALFFTLDTIGDRLLSPWLLPALAAAASVTLLGATVLWARRITPATEVHQARQLM